MTPDDPLARLHRDLNLKRLNPVWAKAEIVFGLFTASCGLMCGVAITHVRPWSDVPWWAWLAAVNLMALGGYLALAGHRSHMYQSNNRLAAHLADLIRSHQNAENPK